MLLRVDGLKGNRRRAFMPARTKHSPCSAKNVGPDQGKVGGLPLTLELQLGSSD